MMTYKCRIADPDIGTEIAESFYHAQVQNKEPVLELSVLHLACWKTSAICQGYRANRVLSSLISSN